MIKELGMNVMLLQLAEEASELAQAALKMERVRVGVNPTPVTYKEAYAHLEEEYTDVIQCARELKLRVDEVQIFDKERRFYDRWRVGREFERRNFRNRSFYRRNVTEA